MKRVLTSAAMTTLLASGALAGGVERSQQSVGLLFEDGDYAEFSLSFVDPTASGTSGANESGDMAPSYTTLRLGYKMDVNEKLSFALVYDESIGADVAYPTSGSYPLAGTTATLDGFDVTGFLKYEVQPNVSVYGGLRVQSLEAQLQNLPTTSGTYNLQVDRTAEVGYVLGAAYEIPDIALRVAVTYNSAITHGFEGQDSFGTNPGFETTIPQSVNLEWQTGVAADTLLFGSVRWQDWSEFEIIPRTGLTLANYDSDYTTFNLGLGRRFSENWSGAVTLGYEGPTGDTQGNLAPRDGYKSIGLGATYTKDSWEVSGGVRYIELGDATTSIGAEFQDNSAIAAGIRIAYNY